ncbi:DUF1450 domain-containing protein [Alkalihalobacillus alcalophilus]|uniref:DUF1450 domain-containing protein n=1 Tax=Alkalihalobacillus alcalophilus TaxID=1445 RepID=UPI00027BB546
MKLCPNNASAQSNTLKNQLNNLPSINIVEKQCLNYCGQCIVEPFCLINGKNISSDTVENLYSSITKYVSSQKSSCV